MKRIVCNGWLLSLVLSGFVGIDSSTGNAVELDSLRMNQDQVIGTHNSYHIAPREQSLQRIALISQELAESLDYTHATLTDQLEHQRIRQFELDVFADPEGGLYANPVTGRNDVEHDPQGRLQQPGMKVLHVQDIDYRTRALTLVSALHELRAWSQRNPRHFPVIVLLELKEDSIGPQFTQPLRFGPAELDAIDAEILTVFPREEIVKPDDVRGEYLTLRQAVLEHGWPKLEDARGKVLFALDNEGEMATRYLDGHPALRDRLLFVSVDETHEAAAFRKLNDPVRDIEQIQRLVKAGFLVRTRADAGTRESRANEVERRDKALASGAQYVSTDYPVPDNRFSPYRVALPNDAVARVNPVDPIHAGERSGELQE
jgi:hypothetical protein